ncbi:MAG: outer membrane beta-barrel protein [Bacteroidetes bacterium]|nr:outer membrane beta-barrel protein [Bacteroidota bacterium]
MRKLLFVILLVSPLISSSQYWEVGLFGGVSGYTGDLVQSGIDFKELHPATGAIVRYNVNQWFTVKVNGFYGTISGNDANASTFDRKARNLSFNSSLLDIGVQSEINLIGYSSPHPRYNNSPYLLFGVSVFRFNPKAEYLGEWFNLQPLGTEGQGTTKYNDRDKYALTQLCIPLGFGWKYALSRYWNVGFEFGYRVTFTDYLDDVSKTFIESDILIATHGSVLINGVSVPIADVLSNRSGEVLNERIEYGPSDDRGDPTNNDAYFFTGFTISYSILPNACYRF